MKKYVIAVLAGWTIAACLASCVAPKPLARTYPTEDARTKRQEPITTPAYRQQHGLN